MGLLNFSGKPRFILMIIDNKLITVLPGSNFKITHLSYFLKVIGVTFNRSGVLSSWLYQNCLEQLLTIEKGLKQSTIGKVILQLKSSFCYFMLQT